jgi:cyclopropane fatty-acyl-phospholipid synthase-like methyltransferase
LQNPTPTNWREGLRHEAYPLSSNYEPEWILENEMGPNVLWITEALMERMDLKPGLRVLDLGCGTAMSSIFLAREFGLQVWAADLWIRPTSNWKRIRQAGLEDRVFPLHTEARRLPFAEEFFDAVVSMDSYHYFGTDVHYLEFHLLKLVKKGGALGIAVPASPVEVPHPRPAHLDDEWYWLHGVDWWRTLWERTPGLDVEAAESIPGGWELWRHWNATLEASGRANRAEENRAELAVLREDGGRHLGFMRMVARRSGGGEVGP